MEKVLIERDNILKALSGKMEGFYLAGGTALSLFYFHHRESYDLDFFTKEFSRDKIDNIISGLIKSTGRKFTLEIERDRKDMARIMIYHYRISKNELLKIDFVEDVHNMLKPIKILDGVPVLSLEDIYIRKIFAICGSYKTVDIVGRETFAGNRQQARDFFDLYFLSTTCMPLSKFAFEYCSGPQRESIAVWYRSYNRSLAQMDILDIATDKDVSFRDMDNHFRYEVEQMVRKELQ